MAEMKNHRRDRAEKMMAKYACGGSVSSSQSDGEPDMDTRSQRQGKKRGGSIEASGNTPKKRLDKRKRYASGGGIDDAPKEKKSAKTQVNVIITGGNKDAAPAAPMPMPPVPMAPPAGGPPPGAPMGAPPPMPPMARKRGGSVMSKDPSYPIEDGSGGGLGRIQKAAAARKTHKKSEKS